MTASTKPTELDLSYLFNVPMAGNSGPPSTPSTGFAKLYGRGTSNLSLGFMNQGGTDQIVMTTLSSGQTVEHGWGFIAGNATNNNTKTVTFGTALTTITNLLIGNLGYISGSDPTDITSFNAAETGDIVHRTAYNVTTSGFTAQIQSENGRNLAASTIRYGFSWVAYGTKN